MAGLTDLSRYGVPQTTSSPSFGQTAAAAGAPQSPANGTGGGWWDQNPYQDSGGSTPVGAPQAQIDNGGGPYPLSSVSGSGFMAPWTTAWDAPSTDTMRADPAYQFVFDEGRNNIERSSAAKGTLLTGGTLKDLTAWSQGLASQQFDKIYNRKYGEYKDAYNIFKGNQNDQWNRLSGLAGLGMTASSQLQNAGNNFGSNASSNMIGSANAQAAATAGSGATWGSTIGTLGNIAGGLWNQRQPTSFPGYVNETAPNYAPSSMSGIGITPGMEPYAPVGYASS